MSFLVTNAQPGRRIKELGFIGLLVALAVWLPLLEPCQTKAKPGTEAEEEPDFLVRPYLQLPEPTRMTVMWETNRRLPSRVEFGLSSSLGTVAELFEEESIHKVRLEGLRPGTTYYYRVASGGLVSDIKTLKTAPPWGTKCWRMAVYGDSRTDPIAHRRVVEQIVKANVDLVVHTGDIVSSGKKRRNWQTEFFGPAYPLLGSVPLVGAIGNHEDEPADPFSYLALPDHTPYFALEYANAHLVFLDSNSSIGLGPGSNQFQWMKAHIHRPPSATWTFAVFHHPLFSAHASRPINPLRWQWAPFFLDPENHVDGVLTGHDHFYARNYPMGYVSDRGQPGVVFLTTAGGGAALYPTKNRDYVAQEKAVHHFSLFEFDGDKISLSAIDQNGKVFDHTLLTKGPRKDTNFCAYEVEDLKQSWRRVIEMAPKLSLPANASTAIDTVLEVPHRFKVSMAGTLRWQEVSGWIMEHPSEDFLLQPGQPLKIPLQAVIAAGAFAQAPSLTMTFREGKFRNRTIVVSPFKWSGPERLVIQRVKNRPTIKGNLDPDVWKNSPALMLLNANPSGGRGDEVKLLADQDWLYVGANLEDPFGKVHGKPGETKVRNSRLVMLTQHFRIVLADGMKEWLFALAPDQSRFIQNDGDNETEIPWQAIAKPTAKGWVVEMAIPRNIFFPGKLEIKIIHRRLEANGLRDYELNPVYRMGNNPDRIPDWKPTASHEGFVPLVFE